MRAPRVKGQGWRGALLLVSLLVPSTAWSDPTAPSWAGAHPFPPPAEADRGQALNPTKRKELRLLVPQYHAHLVAEELELSEEATESLRPRLNALFELRQESSQARRKLLTQLRRLSREGTPGEATEAIDQLVALDQVTAEQAARLRSSLLSELSVRQQSVYLAFEDAFRQKVLRRLRGRAMDRGGDQPGALRPGARDRVVPESIAPGRPMERGQTDRRKDADSPRRPDAPRDRRPNESADELSLRFLLFYKRETRPEAAELCALMGPLDDFVAAQLAARRDKARTTRRLRTALSADRVVTEADLRRLNDEALQGRAESHERALSARAAVLAELDPLSSATFLVLSERFQARAGGGGRPSVKDGARRRPGGAGGIRQGRRGGSAGRGGPRGWRPRD